MNNLCVSSASQVIGCLFFRQGFFETLWQISQYHNAVACGSVVNSIGSSVHYIVRPTRYRVVVLTFLQFGCGSAAPNSTWVQPLFFKKSLTLS
jgi:hypothetical protein